MTTCNGERADEVAEEYIQGSLPEFETERFEDHYFECAQCFARVQALQSVQQELASRPAIESVAHERWHHRIFALGAIAAVMIVGIIAIQNVRMRHEQASASIAAMKKNANPSAPANSSISPPSAPVAPASSLDSGAAAKKSPVELAQLADLSLPPYAASSLRSGTADDQFAAGMQAYTSGDCAAALPDLASVVAPDENATAAQFYAAACQLASHRLEDAIASFKKVIHAGDSPQLEAANYYLAQTMLERGDAAAAQGYLRQTIALRGDYEQRARDQIQRLNK